MKAFEAGSLNVGDSLVAVGAASDRTAPKVHNLRTAMSSFDGVLASMGVNIGAEVRGLNDLADASGKTFTQLGLVATAGLAAGAALAGWKIGRLVADFFDLDKAIGNATAKMLGWGNVSGETAGAQQDVVTRAIERGAAATITYTEALTFNDAWLKTRNTTLAAAKKADDDIATAMIELNSVGKGWQGTLDTINGSVVEAIKFYLAAGVSQGVLATAFGVTAVQVKSVASAMADQVEAMKYAEAGEKSLAEFRQAAHLQQIEIVKSQAAEQLKLAGVVNAAILAEFNATVQLNAAHGLDAQGRLQVSSAAETLRKSLEALHATKAEGIAQTNQEIAITQAYTQTLYAEALAQDALNFGGAAPDTSAMHSGQRGPGINQGGQIPFGGVGTLNTGAGFHLKEFSLRAGGGPVSSGQSYVVGERGPELFVPGQSGTVLTDEMVKHLAIQAAEAANAGNSVASMGFLERQRQLEFQLKTTNAEINRLGGTMVATTNALGVQEIARLSPGGPLFTPGSGRSTPATGSGVNVTIYVNGTAEDVARKIADKIMQTVKSGTKVGLS